MVDFGDYLKDAVKNYTNGGIRSDAIPRSNVCSSKKELADWFMQFAKACRAALTVKDTNEA